MQHSLDQVLYGSWSFEGHEMKNGRTKRRKMKNFCNIYWICLKIKIGPSRRMNIIGALEFFHFAHNTRPDALKKVCLMDPPL